MLPKNFSWIIDKAVLAARVRSWMGGLLVALARKNRVSGVTLALIFSNTDAINFVMISKTTWESEDECGVKSRMKVSEMSRATGEISSGQGMV